MIFLTATTDTLELITSAVGAVDTIVSYNDINNTTSLVTPGRQQTNITTAATTTILTAPAAGVTRQVKHVTISNKSGSVTQTLTPQVNANAVKAVIVSAGTLAPNETLIIEDGRGVSVLDPFGKEKALSSLTGTVSLNPLPTGTNTLGQVNGNGASVEVVPIVTAGAYTAGKDMGGVMTFASILPASFNGVLESITLKFKATVQLTEFDVALFSAAPAGTFTDGVAPAIAAADSALLLGVFQLVANQSQLGTHTIYTLDAIGKQIIGSSTSLFAVVTTKAAPVNPASTTDMSLRIGTIW